MPNSSFDSLVIPKAKAKKFKRKWRVTKKNYDPYYSKPIKDMNDLHKMIANPAVQSLQKRLRECYRRLNKTRMAVTKIEHHSPRKNRRRSVRRSVRRSPRRSVRRSPRRRRSVRRSPRRRSIRSRRNYGHHDPVAYARARAREKRERLEGWRHRN